MPLAGYRNVDWLMARLLPADMAEDSAWAADVAEIGKGMAALFDRMTGRTLRRTEGATTNVTADMDAVTVLCYPIESLDGAVVIDQTGSRDVSSQVAGVNAAAGIVRFFVPPGESWQTLSIEVTGGYWCQDGDDDEPEEGMTALPDDLLAAWVMACRAYCEAEDVFRGKAAGKADKKSGAVTVAAVTLPPAVRQTLQLYTRQP